MMKYLRLFSKVLSGVAQWALSVPVFFKIMGIGALVGTVFGVVTLLQVRGAISLAFHELLEARCRTMALSLAADVERAMSTADWFSVDEKVHRMKETFADVQYAVVQDRTGRIVAHNFADDVPRDLIPPVPHAGVPHVGFRVLSSRNDLIFDVTYPILNGRAGFVRLGLTDRPISEKLGSLTWAVLWTLAFCTTMGVGLAILLTHILTRPIRHLVQAAKQIRMGNFETRSRVFSSDEIGHLAVAFNEMSEGLMQYRDRVQEKEKSRLSLIEKIVHAQEEERRSLSRELHDHVGQSLLALLLTVQSLCQSRAVPPGSCRDIESRIRQLIEEVRQLAWGMRPSILDDYGLNFALARHAEEMAECYDLAIDYQYSCPEGLGRLRGEVEVTLYRIAQEAILNIVRHARATRASAVLLQRSREVTLVVEDDGCGFDLAAVEGNGVKCLGLTGMKERAALLGGACAVESARDVGTTIRVRIPVNESEESHAYPNPDR
jgi:signal transduction histidine kinase